MSVCGAGCRMVVSCGSHGYAGWSHHTTCVHGCTTFACGVHELFSCCPHMLLFSCSAFMLTELLSILFSCNRRMLARPAPKPIQCSSKRSVDLRCVIFALCHVHRDVPLMRHCLPCAAHTISFLPMQAENSAGRSALWAIGAAEQLKKG